MAEREFTESAIGDIGTQLYWFNKKHLAKSVTTGTFKIYVDDATYLNKISSATGTKTFTATVSGSTTTWSISGGSTVTLSEYGITVVGTVANNNAFTITYSGNGAYEYAVPVTAGAEFGGDVESFDAPETDLDYVPKVAGRTSLNDVQYTANYSKERYKRIQTVTDKGTQTYMEVLDDGSAMVFQGTCGMPTIASGDVRQVNFTIVASFMTWIEDIKDISTSEKAKLDALALTGLYAEDNTTHKYYINIDATTVPTARTQYYEGVNA